MNAKQHIVPIVELAKAMLQADEDFAQRVTKFEQRFGAVDDDTLAILSQAAHFCDVNRELPSNLLALCEAIGTGKPTCSFYHCQVSPGGWTQLNTYVVGVQQWLGADTPPPDGVDPAKLGEINDWLGQATPAKRELAGLFLENLTDHLLGVSLAKLGGDVPPDSATYADFSGWYGRPDGSTYATGDVRGFLKRRVQGVRDAMSDTSGDAAELIAGILTEGPPPCVYKYARYLDIQLTSIGSLKWRGNVPPKDELVTRMDGPFHEQARVALKSWSDDAPLAGDFAAEMHRALGEPTERKMAIVCEFLNIEHLPGQRDANEPAFDWLAGREERPTYEGRVFLDG